MRRRPELARFLAEMSKVIGRDEVRRMVAESGAQVVEVLPHDEFESEHIAGALSLPLRQLNAEASERLDRKRPVIVYCEDFT